MSLKDKGIDVALWILCVDVLLVITWNSLGAGPEALTWPYADKVMHLVSYFTLALLLLLAAVWRPGRGPSGFVQAGRAVVIGVAVFGVLIELAQGLIFERTADATDAAANVLGIFLAWTSWRLMRRADTR